jgi:quinoprotein glucose dehydrogenase
VAQKPGAAPGEWRYIRGPKPTGNNYSPLDQINGENFKNLELAWVWRSDNFGPTVDYVMRSTPLYVDGLLFTVAGPRRTVVAI